MMQPLATRDPPIAHRSAPAGMSKMPFASHEVSTHDLVPRYPIARSTTRPASNAGRNNNRPMHRTEVRRLVLHCYVENGFFIRHVVNAPRTATMIGKICVFAALVLVAALGTSQAAPIVSSPADLIRDDVSKVWWGDCRRDHKGRVHCRRCWYGTRGDVHCTRDLAAPSLHTAF